MQTHLCSFDTDIWNPGAQKGKEGEAEGTGAWRGGLRMTREGNGIGDCVYCCLGWDPLPFHDGKGPQEQAPKESVSGWMMAFIGGC